MQKPPRPTPRESTETMVRNISRELAEIEQAIDRFRGDRVAEPQLTGTWMAHLLKPADRYGQATKANHRSGVTGLVQRR